MAMTIGETVHPSSRAAWRAWLARHHASRREIWVIYDKQRSGRRRLAYGDAVEEALCFGWIDSIVKSVDDARYAQRFTPRKRGSRWSAPNLQRVKRLTAAGLMTPAGAALVPSPAEARAFQAGHQRRLTGPTAAPRDLARALGAVRGAAAKWRALAPGYRRVFVRWIRDARRAPTRAKRIDAAVAMIARGQKHPLARRR
jgi:uncharacterized protein YdeI (YjbR/CyaY-like superfamily)